MTRTLKLPYILFVGFILSSAFDGAALELQDEAVFKKTLENGLVILAKVDRSTDLVSVDVVIKAGSGLEGEHAGTGVTHLVEHMLFKGTPARAVGAIEQEIKSYGGFINGSCSHDLTSITVTVPSRNLPKALDVLRDMLQNASFDENEFKKEKEVISSEIKLKKDNPNDYLNELLYKAAYREHPYRFPPIGLEDNFTALDRETAVKFYKKMYSPARMVISLVGNVDPENALEVVGIKFGDLKTSDYSPIVVTKEPPQVGLRREEFEYETNLGFLALAYHSTSIFDKNLFAMDVLAMLLGRGDRSRLNETVFKKNKTVHSVSAWNYTPHDPGLFVIWAILDKDKMKAAEDEIILEIQKLKDEFIEDRELESAKRMVMADYIFSRETIGSKAADLALNEALTGDYDFSRRYVEGVRRVTKEDIKKVAAQYLNGENMIIVSLVPKKAISRLAPGKTRHSYKEVVYEASLENGLKIILRANNKAPIVSITAAFLGGVAVENEKDNGISNLTSRLLLAGTHSRKESDISGAIESLGGGISFFSGMSSFGVNVSVLKEDTDAALDILKDIICDSVFLEDIFKREKRVVLAMIKSEDDDIFQRGLNALRKDLFGNCPYGLRPIGEAKSIEALSREDIINFYAKFCVSNNLVISISGDITPEDTFDKIENLFSGMKRENAVLAAKDADMLTKAVSSFIEMEKDESLLLLGFKTCSVKDDDKYSLDIASSVLSGFSGRLYAELRDKKSFAYALGCEQKLASNTGYFIFYVATTADKIEAAKKTLLEEITKIKESDISDRELEIAKRELESAREMEMQANSFFSLASALGELYGVGYNNLFIYKNNIKKVTRRDVKRAAQKYFNLNACAEVVVRGKQQ